jgi:DNA-directed RNA polymerase specialized sigma24 family protein
VAAQGSVSRWIGELKGGDHDAAGKLWHRYRRRITALARVKLGGAPRVAANEDDVALSAFASFCFAAEQGRFPRLDDRDDLWRLLGLLTARKAYHLVRYEGQEKRRASPDCRVAPDEVPGREPGPELAAQVAEECRRLLDALDCPELRRIALWKLEGHTNPEIAARLDCAPRTVERKLNLIRCIWEGEQGP